MIILLAIAIVFVVGYCTLPTEVWKAIASNCCSGDGIPRFRYVTREAWGVVRFYADMILMATLLSGSLTAMGAVFFDSVLPLPLATESIRIEPPSDLVLSSRSAQGTSKSTLHAMHFFWKLLPIAFALAFAMIASAMHVFSVTFQRAIADFSEREFEREFRRTHRRYLRDCPPSPQSVIV